ncbi:unnamed protein product [Ectocarpus sp. 12 AP-2014]
MACRTAGHVHLKVDARIPRRLLAAADAPPPHPKRLCWTRVPRVRARRVTWKMPTASEWTSPIFALADAEYLEFGGKFRGSLDTVAWPRRLKTIEFSGWSAFNQAVELAQWPTSLQKLVLGDRFNQPIERASWPDSLREPVFQWDFNQPIARVSWPDSVEKLSFGRDFNQPIKDICWPASLRELMVGEKFKETTAGARWPAGFKGIHRAFI